MDAPSQVQLSYVDRANARRDLASAGLMPGEDTARRRVSDEEADLLHSGGWRVVSIKGGDEEGGVTSHRGVLHPDEYVNPAVLGALVEHELGFSYEQVRSVYRQGRLSATQRELRGRIDARLLALSRSGANLALLGGLLGFKVERDSHCEPMDNALNRARKEEQ